MLLLNEKTLLEIQFGTKEGEEGAPDDYSLPEEENNTGDDDATPDDGTGDGETPPDDGDGNTEEEDTNTDTGGDDYTMGDDPDTDDGNTEDGDDGDEIPPDDTEDEESDTESVPDGNIKKKKRLLSLYKKFYNDLVNLSSNIGERISPLNNREEYLYKIIVDNIEKNKNLLYEYIETIYNTKDYEENIYQFYYFSSQVEMIHILLKKIKTYRDNNENNIIKK